MNGPPGGWFNAVAAHPTVGRLVYASTQKRLYRSFDGGETWEPLSDFAASQLLTTPDDPDSVYAIISQTVHRSTDRGETWTSLPFPDAWRPVARIALAPNHPEVIFAATNPNPGPETPLPPAVLRSTDGGLTWTDLGLPLPASEGRVQGLAVASDQELWLGTGGGLVSGQRGRLYHTTDGGRTWAAIRLGANYPEQAR